MGAIRDRCASDGPRTHEAPPTGRKDRRPTREPGHVLSTEIVGRGGGGDNHLMNIREDDAKFEITLDVHNFRPEELKVQ